MGNLCGKPSKENDPFSQPGRAVGSATPAQSDSRVPVPRINSQGRKLGGGGGGSSSGGESGDARSAAARAAEVRKLLKFRYCGPGTLIFMLIRNPEL